VFRVHQFIVLLPTRAYRLDLMAAGAWQTGAIRSRTGETSLRPDNCPAPPDCARAGAAQPVTEAREIDSTTPHQSLRGLLAEVGKNLRLGHKRIPTPGEMDP
jgi:hypothetical protein